MEKHDRKRFQAGHGMMMMIINTNKITELVALMINVVAVCCWQQPVKF
jgi:hypothetical protein